jgi:hypothetical protein
LLQTVQDQAQLEEGPAAVLVVKALLMLVSNACMVGVLLLLLLLLLLLQGYLYPDVHTYKLTARQQLIIFCTI